MSHRKAQRATNSFYSSGRLSSSGCFGGGVIACFWSLGGDVAVRGSELQVASDLHVTHALPSLPLKTVFSSVQLMKERWRPTALRTPRNTMMPGLGVQAPSFSSSFSGYTFTCSSVLLTILYLSLCGSSRFHFPPESPVPRPLQSQSKLVPQVQSLCALNTPFLLSDTFSGTL